MKRFLPLIADKCMVYEVADSGNWLVLKMSNSLIRVFNILGLLKSLRSLTLLP